MICELIDIIRSNPSQIASAISSSNLVDAVENIDSDLIPSKSNKIKDNNLKTRAKAFNAIAFLLPDFKLPGIKEFPGDFDEPPETVTNEVVTVKKLQSGEWYCTGKYKVRKAYACERGIRLKSNYFLKTARKDNIYLSDVDLKGILVTEQQSPAYQNSSQANHWPKEDA
ncbi:unnamed protein product [Rotaria magnacalcarata]|uniref:Uncharacterized protein n=1 Tax=Rotaria magnacalcarata TaxID=392030 RepID=A0A819EAY5_9BILA|nr:unnamed protein product [Rotaria magnacalcarata]CAF3790317.1 unnamed protein product [Rotaria magnacalcarata]CAF3793986.1 unnamed protein product [Rotaria magnacalcarata]CAF3847500.1 unnamed protein product [Rotaria magnacalcarata]